MSVARRSSRAVRLRPSTDSRRVSNYPSTGSIPPAGPLAPKLNADAIRRHMRQLGITEQLLIHEQDYNQFVHEKGIQELGRGAEGTVYFLRGHVVKVINRECSPAAMREIAHMLYLNRIAHTGDMGQRMRQDWPSLLWVYALSDGSISIGMKPFDLDENHPGTTLYERLTCGPAMSRNYSLNVIRGICKSVLYAHRNGIIHHDLKPANIYLPANTVQAPVVFDLGQALWQQSAWGRDWLRNEHNALYWYNGTYRYMHHERRLAHLAAMAQATSQTASAKQSAAFQTFVPTFYDDVFSFARILRDIINSRKTFLADDDKAALRAFYRRLMGLQQSVARSGAHDSKFDSGLFRRITNVFRAPVVPPQVPLTVMQRYASMEQVLPELEKLLADLVATKVETRKAMEAKK